MKRRQGIGAGGGVNTSRKEPAQRQRLAGSNAGLKWVKMLRAAAAPGLPRNALRNVPSWRISEVFTVV